MSEAEPNLAPALIERTGPHVGRRHAMSLGAHVVGRGSDAAIELDDADVSRRHARVDVAADAIRVRDLESKNGVFVGERAIEGSEELRHGDRIQIGNVTLEVDHPGARVGDVLAAGGEPTLTRQATDLAPRTQSAGLLLPVLGVIVFGGIVLALLVFG